jgi:hypothetical protein
MLKRLLRKGSFREAEEKLGKAIELMQGCNADG